MKIVDALPDGTRLLLDSAPIIYYFEKHGRYFPVVKAIFERIDKGLLTNRRHHSCHLGRMFGRAISP